MYFVTLEDCNNFYVLLLFFLTYKFCKLPWKERLLTGERLSCEQLLIYLFIYYAQWNLEFTMHIQVTIRTYTHVLNYCKPL